MLVFYDLYDLYAVFVNVRFDPGNPRNAGIVEAVLDVLSDRNQKGEPNAFRVALRAVGDLGEAYRFVLVDNVYTFVPGVFKNLVYYDLLSVACQELSNVIKGGNVERVADLADALHNLPIMLTDPGLKKIPKRFWRCDLKPYREKWDKTFLRMFDNL